MAKEIRLICIYFILFLYAPGLLAQAYTLEGKIIDSQTGESLPGVNILAGGGIGTSSDINGYFRLSLSKGRHNIVFRFVGYEEYSLIVDVPHSRSLKISLKPFVTELEQVVISAGRFEQKLSDIPVSMEILKASSVINQGVTSMEPALSKIPGVYILDGQANIRSGSGWSYGAGSRVLLLLDGIPMLTPDAGDAKWNFLPIELLDQIEVLKGASSVLYGSSALNGIIHFRTIQPGIRPETKISVQSGMYMPPTRKELQWWGKSNPLFASSSVSHSRRIGRHDIVAGMYLFGDAGYRTDNEQKRGRLNLKYRYRDKKFEGLTYGANANMMFIDNKDFFLWQNADSGAWMQNPAAVSYNKGIRANIDPYLIYHTPKGRRHSLLSRFFTTSNDFPEDPAKDNRAYLYYGEYQYYRKIGKLNVSAGANGYFSETKSEIYGNHSSNNAALFSQFDFQSGRWVLSAGFRYERFRLDTIRAESRPVYRAGMNYRITPSTFLRGSYGMGYRFPSIAEKFTMTTVGGVNVFPSPKLSSESGWNAEIGIKQGLKISGWNGYFDMAAFVTEYKNMMEFVFGFYDTITFYPTIPTSLREMGFQSQNIGMARISGIEASILGQGKAGKIPLSIMLSYTYSLPLDINSDSNYRKTKADDNEYLKYRNIHSFKADIQIEYRKFEAGWTMTYNSKMLNIDAVFVDPVLGELILPGYRAYREDNTGEHFINDARISYKFSDSSRFSLIAQNIFNKEYIGRPGDIRPPRTLVLQYNKRF